MALQVKTLPAMQKKQELWALSLGWEDASEAEMATHSSIIGRSRFDPWVVKIPWRRVWQPIPVFLPGESPWTEEPGGLLSKGAQAKSLTQLSN